MILKAEPMTIEKGKAMSSKSSLPISVTSIGWKSLSQVCHCCKSNKKKRCRTWFWICEDKFLGEEEKAMNKLKDDITKATLQVWKVSHLSQELEKKKTEDWNNHENSNGNKKLTIEDHFCKWVYGIARIKRVITYHHHFILISNNWTFL